MDLLSPKMDFIFKQIFGSEENKEVLVSFLNAVLKPSKENMITEVFLKDTDIEKVYLTDNFSRLDIKATTNRHEIINIEIQLENQQNMIKRTLYYWSKLYTKQLGEDQNYAILNKTICINILNSNYLKEISNFHSSFRLKEISTNIELTNIKEIHFIELPKLKNNKEKDLLTAWCQFLNNPNSEEVRSLENEIDEIKIAKDKLIEISANEEQRRLYELREKQLLDESSIMYTAKELGKEEKANEIAINMIKRNMPVELISEITKLSIDKIKLLK